MPNFSVMFHGVDEKLTKPSFLTPLLTLYYLSLQARLDLVHMASYSRAQRQIPTLTHWKVCNPKSVTTHVPSSLSSGQISIPQVKFEIRRLTMNFPSSSRTKLILRLLAPFIGECLEQCSLRRFKPSDSATRFSRL